MGETRLEGDWRVGDVVRVRDPVTSLGRGQIVDVRTLPGETHVVEALVRFQNGPAGGVWYSVGNLTKLQDIYGRPLDPFEPDPVKVWTQERETRYSVVTRLPGYSIHADITSAYVKAIRKVKRTEDLRFLVGQWLPLWEMGRGRNPKPDKVRAVDDLIVSGQFDAREALRCLRRVLTTNKPCKHADPHPVRSKKRRIRKKHYKRNLHMSRLCVGMELLLPWSALVARQVCHKFGVPEGTAFHQLFCDDSQHSACF